MRPFFPGPESKCGLNPLKLMGILVALLMSLSVLLSVSLILRDPSSDGYWVGAEVRNLEVKPEKDETSQLAEVLKDQLYGGLLPIGFDEKSCLGRYQSVSYHKELGRKPSPYLISRLRRYEALHKRCGPSSELYRKTLQRLKDGQHAGPSDCNYVVWISFNGLGNRILSLSSAFLYALLTDRVLLVDLGFDIPDLFCEPFPGTSWLLSADFPIANQFSSLDQSSPNCYGNMLKNHSTLSVVPPFVYLYLVHDCDDEDKLFFREQHQAFLKKVPWLIMKTDSYFIPSMFLIPSFEEELSELFPEKETVFHFLGRYLFHPTNHVWGLIMRFYHAYLAKADEILGIQVRVFDTGIVPFQTVLDQILACTMQENLLPQINKNETVTEPFAIPKMKVVLMTSLYSGYSDHVRNMYWEYPPATGEVIGVYQPSHEEYQQSEKKKHNEKAWAEIYLLSLTDKLVISGMSTFGYAAQGLAGLKPWILYRPENATTPNPPCRRAMSMEPCFHDPPYYDRKKKQGVDTGMHVPYMRHCEELKRGIKLVDSETVL